MNHIQDGDHVVGIDFGRNRNHIVACKLRKDSTTTAGFTMVAWNAINLSERKNVSLSDAIEKLISIQDEILLVGDWFVLEQQALRNPWCYGLAHALKTYIRIKQPMADVRFMSPRKKFTVLDPAENSKPLLKSAYRAQKNWSIRLSQHITSDLPTESTAILREWTKKDDLADAFLYACALIRQKDVKRKVL